MRVIWPGKKGNSIKSAGNALSVLELLDKIDCELWISDLSRMLGINKSHMFRLQNTFEQTAYIEKTKVSDQYRLGLSVYKLGLKFLLCVGILSKAGRTMERLARVCKETVYLAVEVLMTGRVNMPQAI